MVIIEDYVYKANVCLDKNLDMVCNSDEPFSISNENGEFSFQVDPKDLNYSVIAEITNDSIYISEEENITLKEIVLFSPPSYHQVISPVSTIITFEANPNPYLTLEDIAESNSIDLSDDSSLSDDEFDSFSEDISLDTDSQELLESENNDTAYIGLTEVEVKTLIENISQSENEFLLYKECVVEKGADDFDECEGYSEFGDIYTYDDFAQNEDRSLLHFDLSKALKVSTSPSSIEIAEERVRKDLNLGTQPLLGANANYVKQANSSAKQLAKSLYEMQKNRADTIRKYRERKIAGESGALDLMFMFAIIRGSINASVSTATDVADISGGSSTSSTSNIDAKEFILKPFEAGMDIGKGINVFTYEPVANSCLESFELNEPNCPNRVNFRFNLLDQKDSSMTEIEVGAKAQVGVDLGIVSGKLKANIDMKHMIKENKEKVQLKISADYQNCTQSIKEPKLTSEMEALYFSDYNQFQQMCGDKFMSSVTTGGNFLGILLMENDVTEEEKVFTVVLGVNIKIGAGIFSVSVNKTIDLVHDTLKELSEESSLVVYVKSNLDEGGVIDISTDEFVEKFEEFLVSVNSADCRGSGNYNFCKYKLGNYSDYSTIISGASEYSLDSKLQAMSQISSFYQTIQNAKEVAIDIKENPDSYYEANDNFNIDELVTQIDADIETIQTKYIECTENIDNCVGLDDLEIKSIELISLIPTKRVNYPQTCLDAQSFYLSTDNREYILYYQGDLFKPYQLYCDEMNTGSPIPYLKLYNKSPIGLYPLYNYTKSVELDEYGLESSFNVKVYQYVKLFVQNQRLYLAPYQTKFVESLIESENSKIRNGNNYFGEAISYVENGEALANINLVGTGFKISEESEFELYNGSYDFANNDYFQVDTHFQDINLSIYNISDRVLSISPIEIVPTD